MADNSPLLVLYFLFVMILICASWARLLALALKGGPIWPPPQPRVRRVPWGWAAALATIGLYLLNNLIVIELHHAIPRGGADAEVKTGPMEQLALTSVANLITLALAAFMLGRSSRAGWADFGIDRRSIAPAAFHGAWMYFLILPAIMLTMLAALVVWERNPHQLETMIRQEINVATLAAAFLGGTFAAPLFEEFLFRGVIQQALTHFWLPRTQSGPDRNEDVVIPVDPDARSSPDPAILIEIETESRPPAFEPDLHDDPNPWAPPKTLIPDIADHSAKSVAGMSPFAMWLPNIATSLLFASVHAPQWPAPLPIFVLSLGLGYVFQRTGSLAAPIALHMLFNANSTILLLLSLFLQAP